MNSKSVHLFSTSLDKASCDRAVVDFLKLVYNEAECNRIEEPLFKFLFRGLLTREELRMSQSFARNLYELNASCNTAKDGESFCHGRGWSESDDIRQKVRGAGRLAYIRTGTGVNYQKATQGKLA